MSVNDINALKRVIVVTLITILSPVVIASVWQITSNHFATKQMKLDIIDLETNYVPNDIFEQYFIRLEESVSKAQEIHMAQREGDLERVTRLENDLKIIKQDIRTLGHGLGLNLRSLK